MPTHVSLPLAKRLHDQQRPFTIELDAYDREGKPVMTDDGRTAQLTVLAWTVWKEDGTVLAFTSTNNFGDTSRPTSVDTLFVAVLTALDSGYKHSRETVYTDLEARPQTWSELPLIYKQIKSLTVAQTGGYDALDKNNNVLMTLTPEGADTLRAFNWNL